MNIKELMKFIGAEVPWEIPGLTVTVIVKDVRSAYGRLEALIEPLRGKGEKWVNISALVLPELEPTPLEDKQNRQGFEVI